MVDGTNEVSDPLQYSFHSLFPRSFSHQFPSVDVSNPNFVTVDSVHSHLKSLVLRSPGKHLEQAKIVLDNNMNISITGQTETVLANNEKDAQEKRPALGLKRAKFSAKVMPRQPDVMLEPTIDIGKLDDPEQFFATYDRMENAKKELQRLRGQPLENLDQNVSSFAPRNRRPSLFGKSATYKHHSYSSTAMDDNSDSPLLSQETVDNHVLGSVSQGVPSETIAAKNLPNARISESPSMETRKSNELDKVLPHDYDKLDEAGVVNILQDKLGIRVKDVDKPSLPKLHGIQPRQSLSSDENLSKVKDTISRLNGMRKAIGGKPLLTGGQPLGSAVQSLTSPSRSKSPLASISMLNRRISKLAPSQDPFSALYIDSSPASSSPEKQLAISDGRISLHESQRSFVHEEPVALASLPISAVNDIASISQAEQQFDEVSQSDEADKVRDVLESGKILAHGESNALTERDTPLTEKNKNASNVPEERAGEASQFHQVVENEDSLGQTFNIDGLGMDESTINEGCRGSEALNAKDIHNEECYVETRGYAKSKQKRRRKSKASSQTNDEENMEKAMMENTQSDLSAQKTPGNKRKEVEGAVPGPSKKKEMRRQSLYAAGTNWEAGVRRSTRIKMRPLEYWRGERFLYGRVHNSLVTVIGVKYASPSKEDQQPAVKVKSFVSDAFKDKFELAASH